jgi:hypothetical protein
MGNERGVEARALKRGLLDWVLRDVSGTWTDEWGCMDDIDAAECFCDKGIYRAGYHDAGVIRRVDLRRDLWPRTAPVIRRSSPRRRRRWQQSEQPPPSRPEGTNAPYTSSSPLSTL